jgi:hypothetical protein
VIPLKTLVARDAEPSRVPPCAVVEVVYVVLGHPSV